MFLRTGEVFLFFIFFLFLGGKLKKIKKFRNHWINERVTPGLVREFLGNAEPSFWRFIRVHTVNCERSLSLILMTVTHVIQSHGPGRNYLFIYIYRRPLFRLHYEQDRGRWRFVLLQNRWNQNAKLLAARIWSTIFKVCTLILQHACTDLLICTTRT